MNKTIERIDERDLFISEFQSIVSSMHVGVLFCDLKGKIVFASPGTNKLHGYKEEDSVTGMNIYDLFSPDSKSDAKKYLEKVLKGIKMRYMQTFLMKKDKTVFYGEFSASLLKRNREFLGLVVMTRNITSKKHIKEEFNDYYQKIEGSISKQTSDILNKINTSEYSGIKLLKTIWQLKQLQQELARQKKLLERQVEEAKYKIDELEQEINVARNAREESEKAKKKLETLLEKQTIEFHEKIEKNERIKLAFLNNITHEIRTPLNGILGFTQLLVNTNCDNATKRMYAETIDYSNKKLLDIMNDIIDLSKIESGNFTSNEKEICLNKELDDIYSTYEDLAKEKQIEFIRRSVHSEENIVISIDKYMFRGILFKLLDNAFKFTNKGYIETGYNISKANKVIRFYVKDTGIGIPDNDLDSVFEKFSKVDSSSTAKYGGCGIGLTIAKAFTEKLGGSIWLESVENEGSTFYFSIPLEECFVEDPVKKADCNKTEIPVYNWKDKNILIVDDISMNIALLEEMLARTGAKCFKAFHGKEAVEFVRNSKEIDLILMDVRMPVMTGAEAVEEIKDINKDILIITQTAYINSENKKEIMSYGFDDYIEKPIKTHELLSLIDRYFQKKRR